MKEFQVGDGLFVIIVPIADLHEAELNAQVMQPFKFDRLTENIRLRGQLEQLPYCFWPERQGNITIVSGHHRVRAARAAGLTEVPCLVDILPMSASEVTAKQIAHNELHGNPDEAILAQLVASIDDADSLLMTGLPENWLPSVPTDDTQLGLPHAEFEWHAVTLLFLSRQLEDFQGLLDAVDARAELVGLADKDQWEEFARTVIDFGRSRNIRSVAAAIAVLCAVAKEEIAKVKQ